MPTRNDWRPMKDGKYVDSQNNYFIIKGEALTIGIAGQTVMTLHLTDMRLSKREEVHDEPRSA